MIKLTLSLLIGSFFLTSCSSYYTFESNIKADNAQQYFSASKVKIFNDESEFPANFQYIGVVEGEDCQTKPHLAAPDVINARTQARQAAFKQQANAVIFTSCVNLETKQCIAQVVCYAKAYRIKPDHE